MPGENPNNRFSQPDPAQKSSAKDAEDPLSSHKIPTIKTMKADVSQYLKGGDVSLVDIAKTARVSRPKETSPLPKILLVGGGILLILGLFAGAWLLFYQKQEEEIIVFTAPSLIFSDKQQIIAVKSSDRSELIQAVKTALKSPIPLNTLWHFPILLDQKFLNAADFLGFLEIKPPINFSQALEGDFMLGVFYLKKNSPFLIFKIRSYELGFSGMLEWEKRMANDFKEIFLIENSIKSGQKFQNKMIKNRDARVLYDIEEKPLLIYSFLSKNLLVIAADLESFEEIIRRSLVSNP
jgi:hypothetical protein